MGEKVPGARRTPNTVLRAIRETERHESRAEFANAMSRAAWEMGVEAYPDEKYVQRLESGYITWPHRTYRNILEKLCGRSARELGFAPSVRSSGDHGPVNMELRQAIWGGGIEITELARMVEVDPKTVERWITLGRTPHPRHRWKASLVLGIDESELWVNVPPNREVQRQRVNQVKKRLEKAENQRPAQIFNRSEAVDYALSLDDEERIIRAIRRPARIDSSVATSLARLLVAHRETEDVIGSAPLVKPVKAQLDMLESLVKESRGPSRPDIIDTAAQWAEYAGWIHASTGHSSQALGWFDRAIEWSAEAGNFSLAAHSLSFKGYVYFMLGQINSMTGVAEAAQKDSSAWVGQRGYDAYWEARGLAIQGDPGAAVRKIHEGEDRILLANDQIDDRPPWNYYSTPAFYALERGLVYRFLGRDNHAYNNEAIASLNMALDEVGEARSSEWAADYIYHLAVAYMQSGSPDKACEKAAEILPIARATGSRHLIERLRGFYAGLIKRWPNDQSVRELGEALR